MVKSIDVTTELFTAIKTSLTEHFKNERLQFKLLTHSNLDPKEAPTECRVYLNRMIYREGQDTLSVNVTDAGRVRWETAGVVQVSFFIPRSVVDGYRKTEIVAQKLKNDLRKMTFGCLWLRNITATPYYAENNCYRYELTANYFYNEIV